MNDINYQKELDKILNNKDNYGKSLLLHSCCAPCSSYVLTYLSTFFKITVFYYNPNITNDDEYVHRVLEQKRLIECLNSEDEIKPWAFKAFDENAKRFKIDVIEGIHDTDSFYTVAKGLENVPEGGMRCAKCFELRLRKTAMLSSELKTDYFGTTLTISPLKNAKLINMIGENLEKEMKENGYFASMWMPSDFKKREGYKHSIELSKEYDLYRQNYCGCEFSKGGNIL